MKEALGLRGVGQNGEQQAADFLRLQGVEVLERNFHNRQGEVDIICRDGEYLVFVEVKYRRSLQNGYASEAVNVKKQKQICKVADYYRYCHNLDDKTAIRYDVIAIQGTHIEWIQNAFMHISRGYY